MRDLIQQIVFLISIFTHLFFISSLFPTASGNVNLPPIFTQDMNNLALSEMTPLDSMVYRLEGYDPEGGNVTFGLIGSENFQVDAITGDVKLVKELDREVSELFIWDFIWCCRVDIPFIYTLPIHNKFYFSSPILIYFYLSFLQTHETLSFLVSIKDKVNESGDSDNDNFVQVPISVIVLDENDNAPEFQNVSTNDCSGKVYYKV